MSKVTHYQYGAIGGIGYAVFKSACGAKLTGKNGTSYDPHVTCPACLAALGYKVAANG